MNLQTFTKCVTEKQQSLLLVLPRFVRDFGENGPANGSEGIGGPQRGGPACTVNTSCTTTYCIFTDVEGNSFVIAFKAKEQDLSKG